MESAERHHRKLRSQGGQDSIENLVLLCPHCHKILIHGRPARSYARGFLVHSWDDPAKVPVRLASVGMALLTEEGWYTLWFPSPNEVSE